jgi:hypothetical protein
MPRGSAKDLTLSSLVNHKPRLVLPGERIKRAAKLPPPDLGASAANRLPDIASPRTRRASRSRPGKTIGCQLSARPSLAAKPIAANGQTLPPNTFHKYVWLSGAHLKGA